MRLIPQSVGHYHVTSESTGKSKVYDVDVFAHEGQGHCTCDDWMYRIGPAIERGEPPDRRFCKHLILAREAFTDEAIARYLELLKSKPPG